MNGRTTILKIASFFLAGLGNRGGLSPVFRPRWSPAEKTGTVTVYSSPGARIPCVQRRAVRRTASRVRRAHHPGTYGVPHIPHVARGETPHPAPTTKHGFVKGRRKHGLRTPKARGRQEAGITTQPTRHSRTPVGCRVGPCPTAREHTAAASRRTMAHCLRTHHPIFIAFQSVGNPHEGLLSNRPGV